MGAGLGQRVYAQAMVEMVAEIALGSVQSVAQLLERLEEMRGDGGTRVVLVTADGGEEFEAAEEVELRELARFELPAVFAWEGALAGPLADVALGCDIRVCGALASLEGPVAGRERVHSLAHWDAAGVLDGGGRPVGAEGLLKSGLVSSVTAAGGAHAEGRRIAEVIASRGPIATRLGKEAIWRGLGQPLEQALRFETDLTLLLQTTKDRAEGVRAFLEKRTPNFTGE